MSLPVFKTGGAGDPGPAGSIPVRLRHRPGARSFSPAAAPPTLLGGFDSRPPPSRRRSRNGRAYRPHPVDTGQQLNKLEIAVATNVARWSRIGAPVFRPDDSCIFFEEQEFLALPSEDGLVPCPRVRIVERG